MGNKVLLFIPFFFNLHTEVYKALSAMKFKVDMYPDRVLNNLVYIFLIRLFPFLNIIFIFFYINKINRTYDYILIVNGEGIHPLFVKFLNKFYSKPKLILYIWDSVENKKNSLLLSKLIKNSYTFDISDSKKYFIKYKPLFYLKKIDKFYPNYDFAFIGTCHSRRLKVLNKFIDKNKGNYYIYIYNQNYILYFFRKYILSFKYKNIKNCLFYKKLSSDEVQRVFSRSNYVIDIGHYKQTGFTFRSIQCLSSDIKVITTNSLLLEYKNVYDLNNFNLCNNSCKSLNFDKLHINNWLLDIIYE